MERDEHQQGPGVNREDAYREALDCGTGRSVEPEVLHKQRGAKEVISDQQAGKQTQKEHSTPRCQEDIQTIKLRCPEGLRKR